MKHLDRVFGCGVNPRILSEKVDALSPKMREKIERVAQRIRLITKLDYESTFMFNPDEEKGDSYFFFRWDLSSLEVYLYCTCIDTLASKEGYVEFKNWIRKQNTEDLTVEKVIALQQEHSNEFGNKKNFFGVFHKLPLPLKSWLAKNIAFLEWAKSEHEIQEERDANKTVEDLATYLYSVWRNPFTHGAKTHPVDSKWDIDRLDDYYLGISSLTSLADHEWVQQPMSFSLKNNSQEWNLWHKKHLDINTILRVVIQCIVYDLLQIEVTEHLIEKNVQYINRHHSLYTFIHTLRINTEALETWTEVNVANTSDAIYELIYRGIPQLTSGSIDQLLGFFKAHNPFEKSLRTQINRYKDQVTKINLEIQGFNKCHPRPEDSAKEIVDNRKQEIKIFLEELSRSTISQDAIKSSRRFYDIWWLIRDNFLYDSINIP